MEDRWTEVDNIDELKELLAQPALAATPFSKAVKAMVLRGGLSNRLYCVSLPCENSEKEEHWVCEDEGVVSCSCSTLVSQVVRVCGENSQVHFIDRSREFKCVSLARDLAPPTQYIPEAEFMACRHLGFDCLTFTKELLQVLTLGN